MCVFDPQSYLEFNPLCLLLIEFYKIYKKGKHKITSKITESSHNKEIEPLKMLVSNEDVFDLRLLN